MAANKHDRNGDSLTALADEPLIAISFTEGGREFTRYFTSESDADAAVAASATEEARALAGAWSDLDWEEVLEALDRIRHETRPTPPIDDL